MVVHNGWRNRPTRSILGQPIFRLRKMSRVGVARQQKPSQKL